MMSVSEECLFITQSLKPANFPDKCVSDSESNDDERPSIRMAPLGATASPEPNYDEQRKAKLFHDPSVNETVIKKLEEEQEKLTSSLTLLTSHFAQIQFRLKQIVDDKSSNIEEKLKELEELAFKGVPDVWSLTPDQSDKLENPEHLSVIADLKQKLEELECHAYRTGRVTEPPTSKVLANQRFIIEELRKQLDINFDNYVALSENELQNAVNNAINDIVNPVKVREKLVDQLKTQILDLERFINYLQDDSWSVGRQVNSLKQSDNSSMDSPNHRSKKAHDSASHLIRKAMTILHLIAASQFGCNVKNKKPHVIKNMSASETKINSMHWGDIRASLEVIIEKIIELSDKSLGSSQADELACIEPDYNSDNEKYDHLETKRQLLYVVRKEFSSQMMKLMQHGLTDRHHSSNGTVSCFSGRSYHPTTNPYKNPKHPWDIIVYFYEMKNGRDVVNSPICKLSETFDISNVGGKSITDKESLLKSIGLILDTHSIYKRSKDSHFKAFICLALNEKKLVDWLKLILKNKIILNSFYESWSYACKMGFDDTLHSLKRLNKIDFELPYDLSVRQLSRIKDAF